MGPSQELLVRPVSPNTTSLVRNVSTRLSLHPADTRSHLYAHPGTLFMHRLEDQWTRNGTGPSLSLLRFGGCEINVYDLHVEGMRMGGFHHIKLHDLWSSLLDKMWPTLKFNDNDVTRLQAVDRVKLVYEQFLEPFELYDVSIFIKSVEDSGPKREGGFGEVKRGALAVSVENGTTDEVKVALKAIKPSGNSAEGMHKSKRFCIEVGAYAGLHHENILAFFGTAEVPSLGLPRCLVSPWIENGRVNAYLKERSEVDRLPFLKGIAAGVAYLHSEGVVHGDLKGNNILVSDEGIPLLCDFGLARFENNLTQDASTTVRVAGTLQWMAVELLMSNLPGISVTKASDMWAFAMVVIELLTGAVPFPGKIYNKVVIAIHSRELPPRPKSKECCDILWELVQQWWEMEPADRPEASEALATLTQLCAFVSVRVTSEN